MKKFSGAVILLALLWCAGCTSLYHRGYYHLPDAGYVYGNTASKVDSEARTMEMQWVKALQQYDIRPVYDQLAPEAKFHLWDDKVEMINYVLATEYRFTGGITRVALKDASLKGTHDAVDNFGVYDYIEAMYILEGTPGAQVHLFLTKVGGALKVSGFIVAPASSTVFAVQEKRYGGRRIEMPKPLQPLAAIMKLVGLGTHYVYQADQGYLSHACGTYEDGMIVYLFPETMNKYNLLKKRFGSYHAW